MSIDAPHNDRWVFLEFSIVTSKDFCTATPALSQACSANEANFFIKNIEPKFHFGQQLSSLVAVYEASITTRNVEG
jgi:hypothetical protein